MESGHCVYSQIWRNVWRNDFVLFVSLHCEAFEPEIDDFLDGALRSRHLDALEF